MTKRLINSTYKVDFDGSLLYEMKKAEATLLEAGATASDYAIIDLLTAGLKLLEIEVIKDLAQHFEDGATVPIGTYIAKIADAAERMG